MGTIRGEPNKVMGTALQPMNSSSDSGGSTGDGDAGDSGGAAAGDSCAGRRPGPGATGVEVSVSSMPAL